MRRGANQLMPRLRKPASGLLAGTANTTAYIVGTRPAQHPPASYSLLTSTLLAIVSTHVRNDLSLNHRHSVNDKSQQEGSHRRQVLVARSWPCAGAAEYRK